MAKIYIGNFEAADKGLLDALRRLGDAYHVFVEFQIPNPRGQRQVDFLVIREDLVRPCIFMLEVKNERRRLRGTINGPWEYEESAGVWRVLPASNPRDQNPIQQAYNTARTMQSWLSSMRALIQDPDNVWADIPTVFPRLVLPVAHADSQLQTDSFTWRFDGYDRCLESLTTFTARDPVVLRPEEIERMAHYLGVQRQPDATPAPLDLQGHDWLRAGYEKLLAEITDLRQEVRELRGLLTRNGAPHTNGRGSGYTPRPVLNEPVRDLDHAYRTLVEVVRDLKGAGRKLVFPNVQEGLWRRLGEFNVEHYGFFKFKEFLQEAARRGIVTLALVDGVDYVSLPGEAPQAAPVGAPTNLEDLNLEERNRFLQAIAQLEARSAYMIRSYIARHLTASAILPLPMYEVRALVNDAVSRGLFARGTRPFRHPATGEMQSLETLTLERGHPWVAEALASQPAPGAEDADDEDGTALPRATAGWDPGNGWAPSDDVDAPADAPELSAAAMPYAGGADPEDELDVLPGNGSNSGAAAGAEHSNALYTGRWDATTPAERDFAEDEEAPY
ncbi:MAG TPA: NERD domain-containing protein [Chloroflexia bacterium]|nr:NERD domain-containing protein [Chloroflexia bacterium]